MPTRNISLTPEQDAFVEKVVQAGEYQNASEAVRDALRGLQRRRREDALKLKALRAQLQAGIDALERGEFVQIDEQELKDYVTRLGAISAGPLTRWHDFVSLVRRKPISNRSSRRATSAGAMTPGGGTLPSW